MSKTLTKLSKGDIVKTVGSFALRKLANSIVVPDVTPDVTTILFDQTFAYDPYIRFEKLDDSPSIVTWDDGQVDTFTAAGNMCSVGKYDGDNPRTVTIENHGPWRAGYETSQKWALLMSYNYANGHEETIPRLIDIDNYCVAINDYGMNSCMQATEHTFQGVRRVVIPSSVEHVGSYAFRNYRIKQTLGTAESYRTDNLEVEFEGVNVPTFGSWVFREDEAGWPLRIVVPAQAIGEYTNNNREGACIAYWITRIVGKQTFAAGATLPTYGNDEFSNCVWYSDIECTTPVTTVETAGTYYCKISA